MIKFMGIIILFRLFECVVTVSLKNFETNFEEIFCKFPEWDDEQVGKGQRDLSAADV